MKRQVAARLEYSKRLPSYLLAEATGQVNTHCSNCNWVRQYRHPSRVGPKTLKLGIRSFPA